MNLTKIIAHRHAQWVFSQVIIDFIKLTVGKEDHRTPVKLWAVSEKAKCSKSWEKKKNCPSKLLTPTLRSDRQPKYFLCSLNQFNSVFFPLSQRFYLLLTFSVWELRGTISQSCHLETQTYFLFSFFSLTHFTLALFCILPHSLKRVLSEGRGWSLAVVLSTYDGTWFIIRAQLRAVLNGWESGWIENKHSYREEICGRQSDCPLFYI